VYFANTQFAKKFYNLPSGYTSARAPGIVEQFAVMSYHTRMSCDGVNCGEGGCLIHDGRPQCYCPPLDKAAAFVLEWPRPDSELRCNRTVRNPVSSNTKNLLRAFKSGTWRHWT